jgi:hypothetical protein
MAREFCKPEGVAVEGRRDLSKGKMKGLQSFEIAGPSGRAFYGHSPAGILRACQGL